MFDGRPRAFHSCEISFVFNNADLCVNYYDGTPEALALSRKVSQAWVNFARTGDPNHSGVPKWAPVSQGKMPVMYFDNTCVVKQIDGSGLTLTAFKVGYQPSAGSCDGEAWHRVSYARA
jgi:para-nitrobenzyl esterase